MNENGEKKGDRKRLKRRGSGTCVSALFRQLNYQGGKRVGVLLREDLLPQKEERRYQKQDTKPNFSL